MRKALKWISAALFVLLGLSLIAFGVLYASVHNLLWFHAAAVPDNALEGVRPLYFALMKLVGGASAGLGVLGLYVALVPVRRGVPLAASALALCYSIPLVMAAFVAEMLANATGAPTSWHVMGLLLAVNAVALLAHAASRNGA